MAWFKVDDTFWSNPKVLNLSDSATALWVRAGAYCCQHLTDGVVFGSVLRFLGDKESAEELVAAGLWKTRKDGFVFHDWADYQETSDEVKKRREQARERMRRVREQRKDNAGSSREQPANVREKFGVSDASPDPTRPDPTLKDKETPNGVKKPTTRKPREKKPATRMTPEWQPTREAVEAMRQELPGVDLQFETKQFVDHWLEHGELRPNWLAGWRKWMRNAGKWAKERQPARVSQVKQAAFDEWLTGPSEPSKPDYGAGHDVVPGEVVEMRAVGW